MPHNFDPFLQLSAKMMELQPRLAFRGQNRQQWQEWHDQALDKFRALLGRWPEPVALEPEVIYCLEHDGLIRERVILHVEAGMDLPCIVLRHPDVRADGSHPAILCSHGHGPFGKDAVAGFDFTPERAESIRQHNYAYGQHMAREGFLTLCPDLRVFGERRPAAQQPWGGDPCNHIFIQGLLMGYWSLTLNIWDMMRCIDYLETRLEVAPERIGMMGLSQGGTMTTFTAACEPRIRAADIIGYVNSWKDFDWGHFNLCGSQVIPGMLEWLDVPDIAGLVSPRPLLLEMGIWDECFPIDALIRGARHVEAIYTAAGAADRLWQEVFPGTHAFSGGKAVEFFKQYL
jgi:hypothetical protein